MGGWEPGLRKDCKYMLSFLNWCEGQFELSKNAAHADSDPGL